MNEKPILFSAEMVRSILEGRKTQTRRVVNLSRVHGFDTHDMWKSVGKAKDGSYIFWGSELPAKDTGIYYENGGFVCPYGEPGDRLWVRETFSIEDDERVIWKADRCAQHFGIGAVPNGDRFYLPSDYKPLRWRPSIYMPRWASRIALEVISVRVERVQDITKDDAKAEGVSNVWRWDEERNAKHPEHFLRALLNPFVANYSVLWDEINAKRGYGWAVNPWVWVVEFKVV